MGFALTLAKFAKSPEGAKVFLEASRLAKDPRTRAKIAEARRALESGKAGTKPR